uniref:Uncharacterized protein n=1 Tax=Romanomermis culicivorax TaxID=13658 RepID=A0A915IP46_ROMCU
MINRGRTKVRPTRGKDHA